MTVVVAWLALLVSVGSMTWQVISWRRSGARLLVELVEACPADHRSTADNGVALVVTNDGRLGPRCTTYASSSPMNQRSPCRTAVSSRSCSRTGAHELDLPVKLDPGEELVAVWEADRIGFLLDNAKRGQRDLVGYVRSGNRHIRKQAVRGARAVKTLQSNDNPPPDTVT